MTLDAKDIKTGRKSTYSVIKPHHSINSADSTENNKISRIENRRISHQFPEKSFLQQENNLDNVDHLGVKPYEMMEQYAIDEVYNERSVIFNEELTMFTTPEVSKKMVLSSIDSSKRLQYSCPANKVRPFITSTNEIMQKIRPLPSQSNQSKLPPKIKSPPQKINTASSYSNYLAAKRVSSEFKFTPNLAKIRVNY